MQYGNRIGTDKCRRKRHPTQFGASARVLFGEPLHKISSMGSLCLPEDGLNSDSSALSLTITSI